MKQSEELINKIDTSSLERLPDKAMAIIRSSLSSIKEAVNGSKYVLKSKAALAQPQRRFSAHKAGPPVKKIWHYQLYLTDGYINPSSGAWPPGGDSTSIPGWKDPIYIWGFTDLDPNISSNLMFVPKGAAAPEWLPVGNAKFPGPFLECAAGDDLFITVYNRGFFQKNQKIQDDITLHLHGINSPAQYDGFPESAGRYEETLRYFWEEDWYKAKGTISRLNDDWWNALSAQAQQALLKEKPPLIKPNRLNQAGGIYSLHNDAPYPDGIGGKIPDGTAEDWTRFTYHFQPMRPGTFMYYGLMNMSEDVNMGMCGALVVRPSDASRSVYGMNSGTDYDQEFTFILSEFDPRWHRFIEGDEDTPNYYQPEWQPELWFINGRTFPQTLSPFAWNKVGGSADLESRYNTHLIVEPDHNFLVRYINAGHQSHSITQQGWSMRVVGGDGFALKAQIEKNTLSIAPGESYEVITCVHDADGAAQSQLLGLAASSGSEAFAWRQIHPMRNQNGCRATTCGIYPGGMMTLIEAAGKSKTPNGRPTWFDPYTGKVEPLP
jgi:FtsP/CotA-like multicopper oxidase with cupredoxin domain